MIFLLLSPLQTLALRPVNSKRQPNVRRVPARSRHCESVGLMSTDKSLSGKISLGKICAEFLQDPGKRQTLRRKASGESPLARAKLCATSFAFAWPGSKSGTVPFSTVRANVRRSQAQIDRRATAELKCLFRSNSTAMLVRPSY